MTEANELPESAPARSLTPEQIAPALAEALGDKLWELVNKFTTGFVPIENNNQFCAITLDPEIHAGMLSVLDEWLSKPYSALEWWENQDYLQDIRLWQLRAVVEFLRNRRGK